MLVYNGDRVCRSRKESHGRYIFVVLLDWSVDVDSVTSLPDQRLENALYCYLGSWAAAFSFLVVSIDVQAEPNYAQVVGSSNLAWYN